MILICGPCVIENLSKLRKDAKEIVAIVNKYNNIDFYFKSSCIKDNRTRIQNYSGPGFKSGIKSLIKIKEEFHCKITTDFHTVEQIETYAKYVDLIQIPAFLAMQTSLAKAASKTGKPIHIKKPQWLSSGDVKKPVSKIKNLNKDTKVFITDRGTTFGYDNVVMDPRHIRHMNETSNCDAVLVDITHPQNHSKIYNRSYAFDLGMSSIASGANGLFIESTIDPMNASCDADSQIPVKDLLKYIKGFINLYNYINRTYTSNIYEIKKFIKSLDEWDVYNPITINGELLIDGNRRKMENQHIRINAIANNIKPNSSYLDMGCNSGFIIKELIELKNIKATGVDIEDDIIKLCKLINKIENLNINFIKQDIKKFIIECRKNNIKFDNVSMLSIGDFNETVLLLDFLLSITKYNLFLEPTNHEGMSISESKEKIKKLFPKKYNIEILTITDYQNRFLLKVQNAKYK